MYIYIHTNRRQVKLPRHSKRDVFRKDTVRHPAQGHQAPKTGPNITRKRRRVERRETPRRTEFERITHCALKLVAAVLAPTFRSPHCREESAEPPRIESRGIDHDGGP